MTLYSFFFHLVDLCLITLVPTHSLLVIFETLRIQLTQACLLLRPSLGRSIPSLRHYPAHIYRFFQRYSFFHGFVRRSRLVGKMMIADCEEDMYNPTVQFAVPSQPRLYQVPTPLPPSYHTFRQPPPMNDLYNVPPSPPADDYVSSDSAGPSTFHTQSQHIVRTTAPPYMSPHLSHQFDTLTTASPVLLSQPVVPSSTPSERWVTCLEYSSQEGPPGTMIDIRCEVNFPPSPPNSPNHPGGVSRGRALRVVFGIHPVQTAVQTYTDQNRVTDGQLCQLTATVPNWSSTGATPSGQGFRVTVAVQVMADQLVVDHIPIGDFTYTGMGPRGELE